MRTARRASTIRCALQRAWFTSGPISPASGNQQRMPGLATRCESRRRHCLHYNTATKLQQARGQGKLTTPDLRHPHMCIQTTCVAISSHLGVFCNKFANSLTCIQPSTWLLLQLPELLFQTFFIGRLVNYFKGMIGKPSARFE